MEVVMIKKFLSIFSPKNTDIGYRNYIRIEYGRELNFLVKNGLSEDQAVYAIAGKLNK